VLGASIQNNSGPARAYEREKAKPGTRAIPDSPAVRSADQGREALPVTSDEKGTLSIARRRKG
jgi:hypothetical protein